MPRGLTSRGAFFVAPRRPRGRRRLAVGRMFHVEHRPTLATRHQPCRQPPPNVPRGTSTPPSTSAGRRPRVKNVIRRAAFGRTNKSAAVHRTPDYNTRRRGRRGATRVPPTYLNETCRGTERPATCLPADEARCHGLSRRLRRANRAAAAAGHGLRVWTYGADYVTRLGLRYVTDTGCPHQNAANQWHQAQSKAPGDSE